MLRIHFDPFPELTGSRLRLRALVPADAERISLLRSDPLVNQYLDRQPSTSPEEAKVFIGKINNSIANNQSAYWVIELKDEPGLVGTICLWNLEPELDQGEIGYELMPAFQGKGLMQEAVELVIDYAFREMGMRKMTAVPTLDNDKSIKVLERNQFVPDESIRVEPEPGEPPMAFYSRTSTT